MASASDAAAIAARRSTTPERLQRALRGDLDTILGKALKKDPAERYGSVAEFADDLGGTSITSRSARGPTRWRYRTAKFVRRHWRGVAARRRSRSVLLSTLIAFYTVRLAEERDRAPRRRRRRRRASATC